MSLRLFGQQAAVLLHMVEDQNNNCEIYTQATSAPSCTLEAGNALNLTLDLQVSNVSPVIQTSSNRIIGLWYKTKNNCEIYTQATSSPACTLEAGDALNLTLHLQVSNVTPVI